MKGSKLYSIFRAKCPVCQEGEVFEYKKFYSWSKFDKMHTHCSQCNLKYEMENGFWYGAMYVSYALTVALSVASFILTFLFYPAAGVWIYISAIVFVLVGMAPITFRASRLIWMNFFFTYDPTKSKKSTKK